MQNSRQKISDQYPIQYPVLMSEGRIEGFSDLLNIALEYLVFFRWMAFKNRPRGNLLLLRSLLMVSLFGFLFLKVRKRFELVLLGIDIDPLLFFFAAVVIGYWSMLSGFYNKSEACNKMYLEMVKIGGIGNALAAKLISASLAIELLTMDLWAHRKFRALFARNLYKAVEHAYSENSIELEIKLPASRDDLIKDINKGKLQIKVARILLDNYQDYLMYSTNEKFKE